VIRGRVLQGLPSSQLSEDADGEIGERTLPAVGLTAGGLEMTAPVDPEAQLKAIFPEAGGALWEFLKKSIVDPLVKEIRDCQQTIKILQDRVVMHEEQLLAKSVVSSGSEGNHIAVGLTAGETEMISGSMVGAERSSVLVGLTAGKGKKTAAHTKKSIVVPSPAVGLTAGRVGPSLSSGVLTVPLSGSVLPVVVYHSSRSR